MTTVHLSVRDLVEAIYLSGDLMSTSQSVERANLGSRIHRMLQQQATGEYESEVYLKTTTTLDDFTFTIDGRADGIYHMDDKVKIEEIKSTYVPYDELQDTHLVHFAQVYIYAYIYALDHQLKELDIQLTYYQIEDEKTKIFLQSKTMEELEKFYLDTLQEYLIWAKLKQDSLLQAKQSLQQLTFPFPQYRNGQRQFAVGVYKTILDKEILFAQAPTGIGKTISTLFPSLKAIGEGKAEKIFYLCAKTITANVAYDTVELLYQQSSFKTISLTAKDKICFLEERDCDPSVCPYAKGYYDRVKAALFELVTTHSFMNKEVLTYIGEKHQVCPFELSLDASLYAQVIICDYNYVFDPRVYLKRYFTERGNYIFLVDEAHNLVDRAREMYSATLVKSSFSEAKKMIPKERKALLKSIQLISTTFRSIQKECEAQGGFYAYQEIEENLLLQLAGFTEHMDAYFQSEHEDTHDTELRQLYFDSINFCKIAEFYDDNFITYHLQEGKDCLVKLFCLNPATPVKNMIQNGRSTIFFSATLSPIDYYLTLLGGEESTKRLSLPSPFHRDQLCCLIHNGISTKYANRNASLAQLVEVIYAASACKKGNYIVFAPSYAYMNQIYEAFTQRYPTIQTTLQQQHMSEDEKQIFLDSFATTKALHLYFCVVGGMFSEGIDLKEDKLIGAIIIGVGLAQLNPQQDLIQQHFQNMNQMGYAYAYQFPGMNKVLQSAGRVIRSAQDKGIVLFVDERYASDRYRTLLPPHFRHYHLVSTSSQVLHHVDAFWKES